ncbi:hypothetical protein ANAEL_02527 [Anaerolineales bacterium]|nr:hypothetical protein ANAEL_02527 [Anaerolineales bacterium]
MTMMGIITEGLPKDVRVLRAWNDFVFYGGVYEKNNGTTWKVFCA